MPVLRRVRERFATERPLAGLTVAACLHVTAETASLVRTLAAGGAQVRLCAANPLSTQDDAVAALAGEAGVAVFAQHGADLATYHSHIAAVLEREPALVLDDGCDLILALHQRPGVVSQVLGAGEETTSGIVRLRQMAGDGRLSFPVVDVDGGPTKRLFDSYGTAQSTVDGLLRATNTLLAGSTVVVAGYGWCGRAVAQRLAGLGAGVVVTEVDATAALDAILQGYRVLPMARAAALGDIFVTVTGNRDVVTAEHFAAMRDGVILANAGHFDVEIDVAGLARLAQEVRREVRPHTDEYVMADGRRLYLLARGRLVNLAAAEGSPPAVMDIAFAEQALTLEWLVAAGGTLAPVVHDVPPGIDAEVARLKLASLDLAVDALTGEQERYLHSWRAGV